MGKNVEYTIVVQGRMIINELHFEAPNFGGKHGIPEKFTGNINCFDYII